MKIGNILTKSMQMVFASSTKISMVFFGAIAVTVAGGIVTAVNHSGSGATVSEERFPASASEATSENASRPPRNLFVPPFPSGQGGASRDGSEAASEMANQLATAASEQAAQNASGPPAEPVSVTPDPIPTSSNLVQAQAAVPAEDRSPESPTATSTGTSTGTAPNTNGYGASVNSASSTSTSTNTAVEAGAGYNFSAPSGITLVTSENGWAGVCQKATVTLVDLTGNAASATYATTVTLTTDQGSFYSDAGCSSASTTLNFSAGTSVNVAYFKTSTSANLSASEPSLDQTNATVTIASAAASLALGQSDLTSNAAGAPAAGVSAPNGVLRINGKLVVADTANNRVLIWNSVPTSGTQAADLVLGQANFTTVTANTGGVSSISLSGPTALASDGTRLAVSDTGNHRVLLWDSFPTTTRAAASHVVGQADMSGATANRGGAAGANTMSSPSCALFYSNALFVCDKGNNRVLAWPTIPAADSVSATFAVGQPDLTTVTAGFTAAKLDTPLDAFAAGGQLFVSDSANERVLLWPAIPTGSGAPASYAIGQASTGVNGVLATSASSLATPAKVRVDDQGRVLVTDTGNNRVLVWNKAPTASGVAADGVIGQNDFTGNSPTSTASSLDGPTGLDVSGTELWVSDTANNRVLSLTLP